MINRDEKFNKIENGIDGFLSAQQTYADKDGLYTAGLGKKAFAQICDSYEEKVAKTSSQAVKSNCLNKLVALRNIEKSDGTDKKRLYRFCYDIVSEQLTSEKNTVKVFGFQTAKPNNKSSKKSQKNAVCINDYFGTKISFNEKEMDLYLKENDSKETFSELIYHFMNVKKMESTEVYNNANLSRQDFYRITKPNSGIKRSTVFNVALGLRLNVEETKRLLRSAGYALNNSQFDLIITYCIKNNYYDIDGINYLLYERGQKLLVTNGSLKIDNDNSK